MSEKGERESAKFILTDLNNEFTDIRNRVQECFLPGYDIDYRKGFLKKYVPDLIRNRSRILFETLVNYLINGSRTSLEHVQNEAKNAFYKTDFRQKISPAFKTGFKNLEFSLDLRIIFGSVVSFLVFLLGEYLILFVFRNDIVRVIISILTLTACIFLFKAVYAITGKGIRKKLEKDVEDFINSAQELLTRRLDEVEKRYEKEFFSFCEEHNIKLKK